MELIEYFGSDEQAHWLSRIRESDWGAGQYLAQLLQEGKLQQLVGENTKVLLLTEGKELVSFCTLAERDDIQPTELTPWIGFVYTFPAWRGRRCAGVLLGYAEALAEESGMACVHISTNHVGLYEKYGYTFHAMMKDIGGEDSRVYIKRL